MRVMGVDPGLKATGYGVLDVLGGRPKAVDVGMITPNPKDILAQKLFKIHRHLTDIVQACRPDVLVLEKLYAHHAHPVTASVMGHTRGVICLICAEQNIELVELSVKRVRKAVVGNGNATKLQTQRVVAGFLNIDPARLTLDASDALALAMGHASMSRVLK
ncbi:MAG: crossover junction endodeoxyribonuclease RuvC [Candidatus Omnitrophica bacterium]|nr:crossover junction endodeoxyribonuclease RuvC [Candidatus Omnitrophota bacterium]